MKTSTVTTYTQFIADNILQGEIKVPLYNLSNIKYYIKGSSRISEKVTIKVKQVQTLSILLEVEFSKYKKEIRIYTPHSKSPQKIESEFYQKLSILICEAYREDNREDVLMQRSAQAWEKYKEQIKNSFKDFKIDNE